MRFRIDDTRPGLVVPVVRRDPNAGGGDDWIGDDDGAFPFGGMSWCSSDGLCCGVADGDDGGGEGGHGDEDGWVRPGMRPRRISGGQCHGITRDLN